MARIGTSVRTMYGDPELDADFEKVHDHFGRNYKVTEVLRQLVRDKSREINNGHTRRDQIAGMREDIAVLTQRVASLESLVDELVTELKK